MTEGFGEPQGGAPLDREGFGDPQGGAPLDREGSGPLAGLTVLVPRARGQAGGFSRLLRERGAETLEVPAIEIRPVASSAELDLALEQLAAGRYDWLVVTSVNGVAALRDRVAAPAGATRRGVPGRARVEHAHGRVPSTIRSRPTRSWWTATSASPAAASRAAAASAWSSPISQ